jgi:hypothetical protein
MERAIGNRRAHPRATGPMVRRISALVRPGRSVLVLDLSATGALVAALRPLRPGAAVHVHFEAEGDKATMSAVVARCLVAALDAERMVYHAALCFDAPSEWVRERQARLGSLFLEPSPAALDATVNEIPDGADPPSADCEATDKWFDIPQSA